MAISQKASSLHSSLPRIDIHSIDVVVYAGSGMNEAETEYCLHFFTC
jgi:hypothetical protein